MNQRDLVQMLDRAASAGMPDASLHRGIMERVRMDDGRARRWRVFVQLMLGAALVAGVVTAVAIGWSKAERDETHATPPTMNLFREGATP